MNKKVTILIITILLIIIAGLSFMLYKSQTPCKYLIAMENAEDASSEHIILFVFKDNKCVSELATSKFENEDDYDKLYKTLSDNNEIISADKTKKVLKFEQTVVKGSTIDEVKSFYGDNWEYIELY